MNGEGSRLQGRIADRYALSHATYPIVAVPPVTILRL